MTSRDARIRIDAHVHLMGADQEKHKCFISPAMRKSVTAWYLSKMAGVSLRVSDEIFDLAYADHLARLVREASSLDKALIFGMDGLRDSAGALDPRTEALVSNDWTMEVVARHPDVFIFGASIHPARPDAIDELDRCAEAGAVCVKWVPPSMGIDPSDARYVPFYQRMKEHGMVLTSHTGYDYPVPPMPLLWPRALGPLKAASIQLTRNPFDRDYLGKIGAGFPLEQFYRGYDVFLK